MQPLLEEFSLSTVLVFGVSCCSRSVLFGKPCSCVCNPSALLFSHCFANGCIPLQYFAKRCIPLQCFATGCIPLQCFAKGCIPLQCFAKRCVTLQCFAMQIGSNEAQLTIVLVSCTNSSFKHSFM